MDAHDVLDAIGVPGKRHNISVFKSHMKFRVAFTDRYNIDEGMHAVFLFNNNGMLGVPTFHGGPPVFAYMLVTSMYIPHAPTFRYLSCRGIKDRRLSIWRESVCDLLRGYYCSCISKGRVTPNSASLNIHAAPVDDVQYAFPGVLFALSPVVC